MQIRDSVVMNLQYGTDTQNFIVKKGAVQTEVFNLLTLYGFSFELFLHRSKQVVQVSMTRLQIEKTHTLIYPSQISQTTKFFGSALPSVPGRKLDGGMPTARLPPDAGWWAAPGAGKFGCFRPPLPDEFGSGVIETDGDGPADAAELRPAPGVFAADGRVAGFAWTDEPLSDYTRKNKRKTKNILLFWLNWFIQYISRF